MSITASSPLVDALTAGLRAAGRARVYLSDIEQVCATADASLMSSPDRRARIGAALSGLAAAGVVTLPARASWDRTRKPPLPKFVTVVRERDESPRRLSRRDVAWVPELAWAADARLDARAVADLRAAQAFLVAGGARRPIVPMRERSLEVFGDEKRIEVLLDGQLFREGRLTLRLMRCRRVHAPFVFRSLGAGPWALVVENHDTYWSLGESLSGSGPVGTLIYGSGNHFQASVRFLADLPAVPERVLYFGDVDARGLSIPAVADRVASACGLPVVEPAEGLYRLLFALGTPGPATKAESSPVAERLSAWLPLEFRVRARELLTSGQRLAQEAVGLEVLSAHPAALSTP